MQNDLSTIEAVMATLHVVPQPPIKGFTDKLAKIDVKSPEAFYLLATYCFDLERKLEYLVQVTRPYAPFLPPALAVQMAEDTAIINQEGISWEQRAIAAQTIMIRLYRENGGDEYEQTLKEASEKQPH